jgi:DNA-binding MarR family transcriptional regulator
VSEIARHWTDGERTGPGIVSEPASPASGTVLGRRAEGGAAGARSPERASVAGADHRGGKEPPATWLTAAEVGSWLSVVRLMTWLPWSIDRQLRRDANIGMVEYQVLAMLSQSPQRAMRMSSLAEVTNSSLSRLSHLVTRLEGRGLVRREPDPADGRFTNAILTGNGFSALADAAPGHVAHVRSLVIDVLTPEQLRRLGCAADRIMSRIDTAGTS